MNRQKKYHKKKSGKGFLFFLSLFTLAIGIGIWFYFITLQSKPAKVWFKAEFKDSSKVFLPKDDAPHKDKVEWWYYNGHLTSSSGKQFSFHYTVFLINGMMTHTISHVSLTDHQTGHHYTDQQRSGGNPSIGTVNLFNFVLNDWKMSGGNGRDQLYVKTDAFNFDLTLNNITAPVLHGGNGIISLHSAGDSYYYSRERMAISGTLDIGQFHESVQGIAWFDHQWGDFSIGQLSWDWFSLQLNDESDIMLYQLRDKANNPVLYTGSFTRNGVTKILLDSDFSMIPGKKWVSKNTGLSYPVEWKITIPELEIDIQTKSIIDDSEFDARLTTYNVYWEGAVKVRGSHSGQGFMELSGY